MLLAALAGCTKPQVLVEAPTCPPTPNELLDIPQPPEWEEWYLSDLDPFCEGLDEAARVRGG